MDKTRTPLPGIHAGLFFVIIACTYMLIPKTTFEFAELDAFVSQKAIRIPYLTG
ncbi:hypothetical protein [Marinobacter sp.]|uniref:hypothetical protein n=1 Tax=Marinobacter sp. TaxID=50741 RepID=UPI003A956B24